MGPRRVGGVTFKRGAEQHSSVGQSLCLGPAWKERDSRGKEGLWSVEFRSLEVGPWVRVCEWCVGPERWRGSPSVEMGPWVGV